MVMVQNIILCKLVILPEICLEFLKQKITGCSNFAIICERIGIYFFKKSSVRVAQYVMSVTEDSEPYP